MMIFKNLDLFLETIKTFKDRNYKMFLHSKPKKPNYEFSSSESFVAYEYKVLFITDLGQFFWQDTIDESKSDTIKSIANKWDKYIHETCNLKLENNGNIIIDY